MNNSERIKELIQNISDVQRPALFRAVVKNINKEDENICTVTIGDIELTNVRLRARTVKGDNDDTLLITPKEGSIVLLVDLSDGEMRDMAVVAYSEVEKISLKIEDMEFKANEDKKKLFSIKSQNESLGKILTEFIEEIMKVVVVHGRTPDIGVLKDLKDRLGKVLEC